ncbi:primosomal protein N' [Nonomuraea sp. NPDC000554]|uniref:primosomal protein N' n=1 Tax=Nonomuraea sp. NPDC000554 TaxID=3154259 RepID=UPI00331CDB60
MTDSDDALLPLDAVRPAETAATGGRGAPVPAPASPVARVAVDNPLSHLDRPFDYLVPETMHETAQPGVRVRVRFAGKLVDGFVLERAESSGHQGRLAPLERVVSPERVLTPEIASLARAVADRYAGTLADVLRLAVPPRHARAEAEAPAAKSAAEAPAAETAAEATAAETAAEAPAAEELAPEEPAVASDSGAPAGPASSGAVGGEPGAWAAYPMGASFLDALRNGRAPRAVWSALPGAVGWAAPVAEAVAATLAGGRGAVVAVPDGKDVALLDAELSRLLGPGRHVALTADLGPAERYRRWLRALRGQVRAVVGTRGAVFAPVRDLGLTVIWDDGDDLHAERLAPYPHAREVLALRAHRAGAAMLIGGYTRTAEATQLIATGWARPLVAARETIRRLAPRVRPAGEDAELAKDQAARQARLPSVAWRALRQGLESGPVLIQVPRRGYLPALACQHCRAPARCALPPTRSAAALLIPDAPGTLGLLDPAGGDAAGTPEPSRGAGGVHQPAEGRAGRVRQPAGGGAGGVRESSAGGPSISGHSVSDPSAGSLSVGGAGPSRVLCHGPLALRGGHAAPYCRWCGRVDAAWRCPACGSRRLRAVVVGARRTAEELGRAFPSIPVRTSGRDGVLATVPSSRALVVATPGAEPVAEGGYAAAVLLDGWALLGRADLRAAEEALRRWMNAAALLRPAAELVVLADAVLPAVQALLRWDPITHAERELAERAELGFPPAVRMATLSGVASAVRQMLDELRLPPSAQVLGPVPIDEDRERAMIRTPRGGGAALAAALKGASGVRAARKAADVVRVCVDPLDLI